MLDRVEGEFRVSMNEQVFRRWFGSITGAFVLAGLSAPSSVVQAQVPPLPPQLVQASPQVAFDIPPQPLGSALLVFGQQSGRQISAEASLVRGLSTQGIRGTMTVDEALRRLLAGTGLTFRDAAGATIALQRADQSGLDPNTMQLDPVQVQGAFPVPSQAMIDNIPPPYAGGQVATGGQLGLLGNRGVMDTPFNQTSYTAQKAQNQQAQTIRDVLIDDPSVRAFNADNSLANDNVRIRGFTVAAGDTALGGLYGMLPSFSILPEFADRIEVWKGPSAMLSGMAPGGSVGGIINVVPKRAPEEPLTQVTAQYNSSAQFGGHADVARRFGADKQFGVRFNGVFEAGQTPIEGNSRQRALAVFGADIRGENVRASADFGYQYLNIGGAIPYLALANNVPLPWAPPATQNYGQPWNNLATKDLFGVIRGEVDLTDRITAYAAFGAHDFRLSVLRGGDPVTISSFYGTASARPGVLSQYQTNLTTEAGVRGIVDTGPINHEFGATATFFERQLGSLSVNTAAYATNLYDPTVIAQPAIPTPAANKVSTTDLTSFALADTLSAAQKRIQLTVGARLQQVQVANFNPLTGVQTSYYDQSAVSPSVALVYKPWQNVSVYGNWIQGLQPGATVGQQFTNAGEVFPPYKTTQYEVGVKVDWGKLTTTASAFQITQPSTVANVTTNTLVLGGEQRNQGIELNVFGEPLDRVRLLAGAMFLNAVLTSTQGGTMNGWVAPSSPSVNLNFAGEWDTPFVRGLTLNARVIYTGSQYIDTTYPRRSLPDWTRFDLGVRYALENTQSPTGKPIVLRFNVENVLDANYWASANTADGLNLGAPRTFRLALTTDF